MIGRESAKNSLPEKKEPIPVPKQPKDNPQPPKNPPHNPKSPTNPNELQFTVYFFAELGQNHMWIAEDSDYTILIDKENSIFPNSELTEKGHYYTITFLAKDAEKFHNQDHVYYFSKNNDKFTLKPYQKQPENKTKEVKVRFIGIGKDPDECQFNNIKEYLDGERENFQIFLIRKNHPNIKQLKNQGKLQKDKYFIVRYKKADVENIKRTGSSYNFNELNKELEIREV